MNILRAVIRPMVAAPFIADGVDAIRRPKAHAKKVEKYAPLLRRLGLAPIADNPVRASQITGAATVVAASMLALGKFPRISAVALTALSVPVAVVQVSAEPTRKEGVSTLINRCALTGALVLASLDREGQPSAMWRASNWLGHQKDVASLKFGSLRNAAEAEYHNARANVQSFIN